MNKGFSVVEIMLAVALFAIFSVGAVSVSLQALDANRLAGEQAIATHYATEGLEAVRSIRNQSYTSLNSPQNYVAVTGGVWTFSPTPNTFDTKYNRTISVTDYATNIKKVTSTVSWLFGGTRNNSVVLTEYLSDFKSTIAALFNGIIIYGDGTTTPKYRTYDKTLNTFSAEKTDAPVGSAGRTYVIKTSPTKKEAIAGYINSTGTLQIMCYDGTTWTNEWTVAVGGTGTTRRFDIAYETNSGKAMVLYSTNATTNEMAYRTKLGSTGCGTANWATAVNLNSAQTTGTVLWVKMASDRRSTSNLITAIWADTNRDLSVNIWSGSAWGTEPLLTEGNLEVVAGSQADSEDFDVEYESLSGDVMLVWATSVGAGANGVRYRTCPGGTATCTWGAITTPPTFADDATNLDLSANPNTDEMVFASIGNGQSDLQIGYWSGSAWTNSANVDITCNTPTAGSKLVTTGWLVSGATNRSVVVYEDQGSNRIDWYIGNAGAFAVQTDFTVSPAPNGPSYMDIEVDPISKDQLMYILSDSAGDLFAKRLVMDATPNFTWTNSDGAVLETTLPQSITSPFSFAYWQQ